MSMYIYKLVNYETLNCDLIINYNVNFKLTRAPCCKVVRLLVIFLF